MMETKEFAPARFRSARPQSVIDVADLAKSGVKKIVSLQGEVLEFYQVVEERGWCDTHGIKFVHVPMNLLTCPTVDQIERALKEIGGYGTPGVSTLVHCHDGVDRTGVVCATWNMKGLGWTFGRAAGDMIDNGFHLNMYSFWLETLKEYFKAVEYRKPFLTGAEAPTIEWLPSGGKGMFVRTAAGDWQALGETDKLKEAAKPKMGAEAPPVGGSLVNGIIDAQVLGYLNAKLTAENMQGVIDRTGLTVQTTISQFLATMTGPTLAAELKNILLPLFQK